ncbi:NAD(P)-dependent oxidoreductase [Ectobacillus panaciterrae]|uniref:NAD(P)-dependent oxidoreductase n=1 Tax=Ectobacillus panaciterrae TaxID=363872 RepID=UPI00040EAE52|nr:SDR family oxidoreductase [Ectobacillus panaciterrae]
MHICLFGATGRVGTEVLRRALQDGHAVTALVRNPNLLQISHPNLHVIEGNVLREHDVQTAMLQCEAVISALGTDEASTLSDSMPLLLRAMRNENVTRIITVGTAGILQARSNPSVYRFQSAESRRKSTKAAEDHLKAYELLKQSHTDWTVVCPTHLVNGDATGEYRTEKNMLPVDGIKITVGDTALFTYEQLFSLRHNQDRVGIAY